MRLDQTDKRINSLESKVQELQGKVISCELKIQELEGKAEIKNHVIKSLEDNGILEGVEVVVMDGQHVRTLCLHSSVNALIWLKRL